jgi:hypothetical protein
MLTTQQKEKLEIIERWLEEIAQSVEFQGLEYYPDVKIGDALQAVREILNVLEVQDCTQPTAERDLET